MELWCLIKKMYFCEKLTKTEMATKKNVNEPAPEQAIENALSNTERFLQDNGKTMLIALAIVVVLVGGFFGYRYLHVMPRQEKAAEAMYVAEQLFAQDDFATALNGDGNNMGFAEVAKTYGNTPQGRLAAHYAGVCAVKGGDLDGALAFLAKYKPTKGAAAEIINAQNLGLQGDIYVEKGDLKKGAEFYNKAVGASNNSLTAPYYLKKLGGIYEAQGDKAGALKAYRTILDSYAQSLEARDIEKYIGTIQ